MSTLKIDNKYPAAAAAPNNVILIKGDTGTPGEKGEQGNSGVYIGNAAPTSADYQVWIDTSGDPDLTIVQTTGNSTSAVMSQKAVSDIIVPLKNDVYYQEVSMGDIEYVTPLRTLEKRYVYPVSNTGMLYLGYRSDGIYKVFEYGLQAGRTYTILGSISATSDAYKNVYAVTGTSVVLPTETGWSTPIPYLDYKASANIGYHTYQYTPSSDCYLYVNVFVTSYNLDGSSSCGYNIPTTVDKPKTDLIKNLVGKRVAFMGDSIFGLNRTDTNVPSVFKNLTGANVANLAISGTRMVTRGTSTDWGRVYSNFDANKLADCIVSQDFTALDNALVDPAVSDIPEYYSTVVNDLKNYDFSRCDYLIINYGTNDYSIGTSIDSYETSFKSFAKKILTQYPNITLIKCTPTQRFYTTEQVSNQGTVKDVPDIDRVDDYYSGNVICWRGENNPTLTDYVKSDIDTTKLLNITLINLYDIGINYYTRPYNFDGSDMTHHNVYGRQLIAFTIASEV